MSKSNMRIYKILFCLNEAFERVRMIDDFEHMTTDCAIIQVDHVLIPPPKKKKKRTPQHTAFCIRKIQK